MREKITISGRDCRHSATVTGCDVKTKNEEKVDLATANQNSRFARLLARLVIMTSNQISPASKVLHWLFKTFDGGENLSIGNFRKLCIFPNAE